MKEKDAGDSGNFVLTIMVVLLAACAILFFLLLKNEVREANQTELEQQTTATYQVLRESEMSLHAERH